MTALLVVSVFAGSVGIVAAQSSVTVTQTPQGSTTVQPGDTLTVDVSIDTTESGSPAIELAGLPSGWNVQATDNDGGSFQSTNNEWFWLGDSDLDSAYTHTVTYEVTIPGGASDGTYQIDAVGSSQGSAAVDDDYQDTDSLSITVESPEQNQPPTASFTASPSPAETGETVSFDASGSSDDSSIGSYSWDFGDGTTGSGVSPTHTYSQPGTYSVELTATDDDGVADTTTQQITVDQAQASSVSISQMPQEGTTLAPGDTLAVDVAIDTTASGAPAIELENVPAGWSIQATDNDNGTFQPNNHEWFWSQDSDLDADYSHTVTYEVTVPGDASDGTYQIDAVGSSQGIGGVDDDYEATDTLSLTVQAQNQPPTAGFSANETAVAVGEPVSFDASGSSDPDGSIASYAWDFGDGDTGSGISPTHAYDAAGSYTVTLTVTDEDGATDSVTETIAVSQPQQSSVSIDQTPQESTTLSPGDTLAVDVSIDTTASGAPAIELENVPAGWSIQATDNDNGTFQPNNHEWFWSQDSDLDADYSHTVTYEVTVPGGASPGTYQIDAVGSSQGIGGVDDDYEDTDTLPITVETPNQPPTAVLSANETTITAGSAIAFDASGSSDPDGSIASYAWNFGDGDTGSGVSTTHTFESAGSYTVTLTVSDENDKTATETVVVTVQPSDTGLEPVDDFENAPADPDGDGLYEDINGDGDTDVVDVQALFANRENDPTIQNNPEKFDFSGNGEFDIVDVQALFTEVS